MKKLEIQPGGHPRKNEDLMQVQASVDDLTKAYNSRYDLPNSLIVGVILSGLALTANGSLFDCSAGWIAIGRQVYFVPAVVGLDMSGGKKLFVEIQILLGVSVTMASSSQTQPYPDYQMSVYSALSKNNAADYAIGEGAEIVPYGDWVAAVINFDGSAYLPSVYDNWHYMTLTANFTSYAGGGVQYRKTQTGLVYLRGSVKAVGNLYDEVGNLPSGYAPNQAGFKVPIVAFNISNPNISIPAWLTINPLGGLMHVNIDNLANITNIAFYINTSFSLY